MSKLKYFFLSLFLAGVIISCETDFDTTSQWEDISVVYGIIDQLDSVFYIKINKAFLGEGDALVYAMEYDSINYPDTLNVKLHEINGNGNTVQTMDFEFGIIPEEEQDEDDVVFPGPQSIYYGGPDTYHEFIGSKKIWLNDEHTYRMEITFPNSSKVITSETILVNHFSITYPLPSQVTIKFTNNPNSKTTFKWAKPNNDVNNAFRYQVNLIFHYQEKTLAGVYQNRSILLAEIIKDPSQITEEMTYNYFDENFYVSCQSQIPYSDQAKEDSIVERYTRDVDFIISVAAEEFNLFLDVYEPSNSVVQDKPAFTNIENGIGLFSSRYKNSVSKDLHHESVNELIAMDNNALKFEE